jgi:hypothetical protein
VEKRSEPDPGRVIVPSRGVRFYPLVTRLTFATFAGLGLWVDFEVIGVPRGNSGLLLFAIILPVVPMVVADLVLEEYLSNRWIEISPNGITAVYKFHQTFAPWNKLTPLNGGRLGQSGFLFERGGGRRTQLVLTYEQLRAVVASPYAPKWVFPPKVAAHLGPAPAL